MMPYRIQRLSTYMYHSAIVALLVLPLTACDNSTIDYTQNSSVSPKITNITPPNSILFIGNSFTYFNDGIEKHLQRLAASGEYSINLEVGSQTYPSRDFSGHYHDPDTELVLLSRSWDVVVLQGASNEPLGLTSRHSFYNFAELLAAKIDQTGAMPALFMTWASRNRSALTKRFREAYVTAGNHIGAYVIPVGLAWEQVLLDRPSAYLFSDSIHPTIEGTYLSACVFYAALFGKSPEGLPYTAGIPKAETLYLQKTAWKTTASFYKKK